MRNFKILVCVALFISLSLSALAQKKHKKYEALSEEMTALLTSREYTIDATTMMPRKYSSKPLINDYYLQIKGDSIFSRLPFFGEAYNVQIGSEGLIFESVIQEYEQSFGKRGQMIIRLSTRTREDYYTYTIEVYSNGHASMAVDSNNRDSIDFMGKLRDKEDDSEGDTEEETDDKIIIEENNE